MRNFDYSKYKVCRWDNEILNYLTRIHELKGKQELFLRQKPVEMEKLVEVARVQSIESSNRIEGIVTTKTRIGRLAREKTTPRDRNEKEIAGYRDVLRRIHEDHEFIPVTGDVILQLHRELMQYADTGNGGRYKMTQNYLRETRPDGTEFIRFTPVPPYETEACVRAVCENYRRIADDSSVDSLLVIPVFLHDFLCIHPFDDGNGRMSRLLTLLLLYQVGYTAGKYVSLERHIEKTKDAYYDALEEASAGWHEEEDDPTPFVKYMLGVVLACYREFQSRTELIGGRARLTKTRGGKQKIITTRSSAYDIVKASVDSKLGKFTKRELADICPGISEKSVESSLKRLVDEGYVKKYGAGRNTFYAKV